jgi:hypothetical protein
MHALTPFFVGSVAFVAFATALAGCCRTSVYQTDFEVTEAEAEAPCEEFCEKTIAGEHDFTSCEVRRFYREPAIITCNYEHTHCVDHM